MSDLLAVAFVFFKIGLLAFGGSTGVLPELERQIVQERGWLTQQAFVDSFALGQLTPGPALVMVMLPGYRVAGIPGALAALLAIFLPSAVMTSLMVTRWEALRGSIWFPAIQRGLGAVALGLLLAGAYTIVRVAVVDVPSGLIAMISFAVLWRWRLHPALVILAGGAVAVALQALAG